MPKLLALDLSGTVGFAKFAERGERPRFGSLPLDGSDLPAKLGEFDVWLEDTYSVDPFEALAWERPLITPTDTVTLLELLYGLVGICHAFVGRHRRLDQVFMPFHEVDVPTAKRTLTGKAKATKDEMVVAARRTFNWEVKNDHEADAGAVGLVAYELIWPKRRAA